MTLKMTCRKVTVQILILLVCSLAISSCAQPDPTNPSSDEKLTLEQYFYSENEESLRKLSEWLKLEGYGINDFRSYELDGKTEWYFYSSKEVTQDEIGDEDTQSQQYAEEFGVGYDGHGFPLD